MSGTLTLNGTGLNQAYIDVTRDGVSIRNTITPYRATTSAQPYVVNLNDVVIGGITYKDADDDTAPAHIESSTLGGNHGYRQQQLTATGHGKTSADVGSIFSLAGTQYVLTWVRDANLVCLANRTTNSAATATGTYTYVSGGSDTSDIVATGAIAADWFPCSQNHTVTLYIDGDVEASTSGTFSFNETVKWVEHYEIISYADRVLWSEAGNDFDVEPSGYSQLCDIDITYEYDVYGNLTIYCQVETYSGLDLDDFMFIQSQPVTQSEDGTLRFYVPKLTTVTKNSTDYDYQLIDAFPSGWSSRLNLGSAAHEDSELLADRLVSLTDTYGLAVGYLPVDDGHPDRRRAQASALAGQISESGKFYPHIIDVGGTTTPDVGTIYSAVCYRNPFVLPSNRTCSYAVRTTTTDGHFLYVDWHDTAGADNIDPPSDFVGRYFTVVESRNCTVNSNSTTNPVNVTVAATGDYAYLVLQYKPMNVIETWKGAVEPAESSPSSNQLSLWKGAVEPLGSTSSSSLLIGNVTRSLTRGITRNITEDWSWGA